MDVDYYDYNSQAQQLGLHVQLLASYFEMFSLDIVTSWIGMLAVGEDTKDTMDTGYCTLYLNDIAEKYL